MKKIACAMVVSLISYGPISGCLNMISNNTSETFKLAEVKSDNADLKQQVYLPEDYVKDEEKAHTLQPGDEIAFGGHYVPTFIIYKEYPDKKWHPLVAVKQLRCGPRGPENKYLLITDLLKGKLPDDYQDVYKFTIKCDPSELNIASTNQKELTKVANPYQEFLNLLDDFNQKALELVGQIVNDKNECQRTIKGSSKTIELEEGKTTDSSAITSSEQPTKASEEVPSEEAPDGESCERCKNPFANKK